MFCFEIEVQVCTSITMLHVQDCDTCSGCSVCKAPFCEQFAKLASCHLQLQLHKV